MKMNALFMTVLLAIVLSALQSTACGDAFVRQNLLVGTWKSDVLETEWGPAVMRFTIRTNSEIEIRFVPMSGHDSKPIEVKGAYSWDGTNCQTAILNKGKPFPLRVNESKLFLTIPGESVRIFSREGQ
jgi:hypothetical protein